MEVVECDNREKKGQNIPVFSTRQPNTHIGPRQLITDAVVLVAIFCAFTALFTALRYAQQTNAEPTPLSMSDQFAQTVAETGTYLAADPSTIPACGGNPECFAFTIDTRLDEKGELTSTSTQYSVPTQGRAGNGSVGKTYSWIINWGDGSSAQTVNGTQNPTFNFTGIPHTYATPGQYQITIRPSGTAAMGWFNSFGFFTSLASQDPRDPNAVKFLSIDTPLTNNMRSASGQTATVNHRFSQMFFSARNAIGIPSNLFANISTTGATNFIYYLHMVFHDFAVDSQDAVIPPGLLNFIDTSTVTNFDSSFYLLFNNFASKNTSATIPPGLLSKVDTRRGTDFRQMFYGLFRGYAAASTVGDIPAGLFSTINTSAATNMQRMFQSTFATYAVASANAVIPEGLFAGITYPSGAATTDIYLATFQDYATRTATFKVGGAVVGTQEFAGPYSTKNISR
jgi:hypothetical protein